ncbi:MAG TPA: adenylate/guanylate cyclase domain-containing protein [Xanthobacteraceae bacterium]|nr:adenylate/guanylate cyclase domain-containing protein [Xanthobacteraceae bacterium]
MAKFLRVGVHQSNVSGYTSKAWSVWRTGSTVLLKWGAVEVRGAGSARQIFWAGEPRRKTLYLNTEARARAYVERAISRRLGHRYERIMDSVPIRRGRVRPEAEPPARNGTILFVDIVRSTEKAALVGDRRWSQVMNHYYTAVRRELRAARGTEVVTTGDGVLATFQTSTSAIRCAAAIRAAVRTLGLEIRAGLHAGEYKIVGDEAVGLAIHIGARVVAKAGASEVLVSSAVKQLVAKVGINFKDRGHHKLKGVPQRWRLYSVDF